MAPLIANVDLTRSALDVAPELIGCLLRVGPVTGRIVEVEAYEGQHDPASHAWRGKTPRNQVMFGPPGRLYVYQLHGHHCCNIVCREVGTASAVLIRAVEIIAGDELARERRPTAKSAHELGRGPGNLCRALGITMAHLGTPLDGPHVTLLAREAAPTISAGPRVNVARAGDLPWRFWDAGSPAVSAYKRHPAARG